jgi:hypothetical protein
MPTLRLFVLSAALLAAAARPAAAIRPKDDLVAPKVEVLRGDSVVSAHVVRRAAGLQACAARGRADTVKARASIRWDKRGRAKRITVYGGTAAFRRCAKKALAGALPIVARRRGSGSAAFLVKKLASPDPLATTTQPVDLHACQEDADCTLHFQLHACVPSEPVAVNKLDPAAVRATYPVRHLDCAMGGPQYDELRSSHENRWTARCEKSRCVVR